LVDERLGHGHGAEQALLESTTVTPAVNQIEAHP
jgi:hypothetical protein